MKGHVRLSLVLAAVLSLQPGARAGGDDAAVDFNRDIRPILSENCLLCHGPDPKLRKAKLRLDLREGALADLDGGVRAVVPGKPEQSELVRRITAADIDDRMPPAKTGKKLSKEQIDLLRRWVAQGAPYARHWSYVKPARPELPKVRAAQWPQNEVDRFILARLEKEGLKPLPEADRYALVRRLALDLTGLPPAVEDVDRFVGDRGPGAYERLVDRLLASPAFGERWAKMWLDLARYADSQGYAEDRPRTIWSYRDWVIQALNANMPFDQFSIEQIAGDLLPNATESQIRATGFHRNTLTNTEGGTDREEFRNVAIVDRVNTTMQVWFGLTFNCANCHDHKFDAFTQEEFFRVFAFFNQSEDNDQGDDRPLLSIYTDEQRRQKKDWEDEIARLQPTIERTTPELEAARKRWEAALAKPVTWRALKPSEIKGAAATAEDESWVAPDGSGSVAIRIVPDVGSSVAARLQILPQDPKAEFVLSRFTVSVAPAQAKTSSARHARVELPGKQRYLHLAEVQVFSGGQNVALKGKAKQSSTDFGGEAKRAIDGNTSGDYFGANSTSHTKLEDNPWWEVDLGKTLPIERVVLWNRTDGGDGIMARMKNFRVQLLDEAHKPVEERRIDSYPNPSWEWSPDGIRQVAIRAVQADAERKEYPARSLLEGKVGWSPAADGKPHEAVFAFEKPLSVPSGAALLFRLEHKALGRVRLSLTDESHAASLAETPAEIRAILKKPEAERSKDEADKVSAYHRSVAPELAPARDRLAALKKLVAEQKPSTTLPIMRDLASASRRKTQVHVRGNFLVKGKEVSEGTPKELHPFPDGAPKNRLGLAQWLASPENPLTARVVVNRHWEQIFGLGLVRTSEDWGIRGEVPTHPELLDWLAVELVAQKWDLKKLIRLMVTSAAYRQSSQVTPELVARDPVNRFLARGPRIRLSAEGVRDQALFVSGLLSPKMFGPSVYPPQPKMGLTAAFSSSTDWETSKGEDKYRRGLYTFWRRSVTYPSMATFDAPDRNVCTVKRIPTNTPLQALVTMNDPVYVECAQALARRIVESGGKSAQERAAYGFRRCLARPPREVEVARLVALFEEARAKYAADPAKAKTLATDPIGPAPEGASEVELAAWTVVGNVLLNLDEMFLKR